MTKAPGWVSAQKAQELLGIDRKTLFKYRDDGTLTLGTHFAAFPGCMSRDGYHWNVAAVRKTLAKVELQKAKAAMVAC
jgi:aspartate ammonia-lyase